MKTGFNKKAWPQIFIYLLFYTATILIITTTLWLNKKDVYLFPTVKIFILIFVVPLLTKYFLYMIISPWHDLASYLKKVRYKKMKYLPKVTVLVPAWNEEVGILNTVNSLLKSSYQNLEIIVVDDGSTDNTAGTTKNFIRDFEKWKKIIDSQITIRLISKKNGGKSSALNLGVVESKGEIIITIDADSVVKEDTVGNLVEYYKDPEVMSVAGNVKIGNNNKFLGRVQYLEYLFAFYFKKTDSILNTVYIVGGAAASYRKSVFREVGCFNESTITEDIEMSMRIQERGMKIEYAADAVVLTEGPDGLNSLINQRLRWKRGRLECFYKYRNLFFSLDRKQNKRLTCLILPLALFSEIQLFFEIFFIFFLYLYSYLSGDFSSFIAGIMIVGSMFFIQIFFDDKKSRKFSFLFFVIIGWLMFYIATFVEYNALLRSLWGFIKGNKIQWQKWHRKGVFS